MLKPLYIVGTKRDVGKTTLAVGLLAALQERGLKTAYLKPLGQHFSKDEQGTFHQDARVIAEVLKSVPDDMVDMAMPLHRGRIEKEIQSKPDDALSDRIEDDVERLREENDLVVVEGMGNVAMGSCLHLSAADVARRLDARCLLVVEAGIGRTIDEAFLCSTFIRHQEAELLGTVISKAWPDKYDRISTALRKALPPLGIDVLGIIPYREELACPTVDQVFRELEGELLGGEDHLHHRVLKTIIGAMQADNMIHYISGRTLVITPGDRTDVIMACLRAHLIGGEESLGVSGLVLTCGHRPDEHTLGIMRDFHLPAMLMQGDTYSVATTLKNRIYKITPDDRERIDWAVRMVARHVDIDGILAGLEK